MYKTGCIYQILGAFKNIYKKNKWCIMLLKCNVNNSAVCVCVVPEAIEM